MTVIHGPCPRCGSKDNLAIYEDGHTHCFGMGCSYRTPPDSSFPIPMTTTTTKEIETISGEYVDITSRKLKAEVCRKSTYFKAKHGGEAAYYCPIYSNDRVLTGYKIRKKNKNFLMQGSNPDSTFLFQHMWSGNNKLLVVFEGEYDALSYMQVRPNWPAVSLPNGCESGNKVCKAQLSFLQSFETVIFCYDADTAGQKAALRDVQLLPPRQGKIGVLNGYKDANEALQSGDTKAIVNMVFNAKEYEPDGIINASKLLASVLEDPKVDSVEYGFPFLDDKLHGLRRSELCTITAGTGQGKSTFVNEIAYNLAVNQNQKVAVISLEENNLRTARRFVGINLNHPLHIDRGDFTDEQIEQAFQATLGKGNIYFYDHFGSLDSTVLLNRIRHCVSALDCSFIIFDHLSILVSGMEQAQDERRAIDQTMTRLRSLVEETNCGMILVSHLRRPSGDKGHEDGQQTSLSGLRGSAAIGQLSDIVLGLERDQQASDNTECRIRVLKNRFSGWLGLCGSVKYYPKTGRMLPLDDNAVITNDFVESDF